MTGRVKLDMSKFEELRRGLRSSKNEVVRVGILGANNKRDDIYGNAEIGLVHEMGSTSRNIPPRSFIRIPLERKAKDLASIMRTASFANAISKGDITTALELTGAKAEAIIQEGFASRGFGQWTALQPETIAKKGSSAPLIDTSELRKSISSKVK